MMNHLILNVRSVYKRIFSKNSRNWNDLFPTTASIVFFNLYILFCVLHGLIISASQDKNKDYEYNYIVVVLLTDLLKLIISFLLFWKNNSLPTFIGQVTHNRKLLWLYLTPALLYCIYNNLSFVSLSEFDPTTYSLLLQVRVVVTGVLFQILFKKRLSLVQWVSLLTLMAGCMLKEMNLSSTWTQDHLKKSGETSQTSHVSLSFGFNICFILIQVLCSCTAGVYNEFLLKKNAASVNTLVQNVYMYFDSILVNGLILLSRYNLNDVFNAEAVETLLQFKVLLVMLNNAALGITTSFFLKNLNSILKTFASALELSLVAILSRVFLHVPLMWNTILSIGIVSLAVFIYTQNPVVSVSALKKTSAAEDEGLKRPMLGREDEIA